MVGIILAKMLVETVSNIILKLNLGSIMFEKVFNIKEIDI